MSALIEALAILSLLVSMLACIYVDVSEHAEHESLLDDLWDDDGEEAAA